MLCRSLLLKKLDNLDREYRRRNHQAPPRPGIDYSSAEEDFTPVASSTKKHVRPTAGSRARGRNGASSHLQSSYRDSPSRAGGGGGSKAPSTNNGKMSLMHQSEEEEEEDDEEDDEEEEDEEDSDDAEEDSEGKQEEYEEEVTTSSPSRNDLAIQTSFGSPEPPRFRGKIVSPTKNLSYAAAAGKSYTLKSSHLRNNLDKFGSLNEALSTLPTAANSKPANQHSPRAQLPHSHSSPVSQASRSAVAASRQSYSRKEGKGSSMIVPLLIISVAALFFLILGYKYMNLKAEAQQRIPLCTATHSVDCIPGDQLNATAELLKALLTSLEEEQSCLRPAQQLHALSDLKQALASADGTEVSDNLLNNLLILLKVNPAWGIYPVAGDGASTASTTHLSVVKSGGPLCWLQYIAYASFSLIVLAGNYILLAAAIVALAWPLHHLWKRYRTNRAAMQKEMFSLVESVLSMLQSNHNGHNTQHGPTYMAINHIRDQLIVPQERETKRAVWDRAVDYIRRHESRVREEVQLIRGEEFRVWQWLPDHAPGLSGKAHLARPQSTLSRSGLAASLSPTRASPLATGKDGRGGQQPETPLAKDPWQFVPTSSAGSPAGWQGSAFNHSRQAASPVEPPTSCLKVRNMFDHKNLEPDWVSNIKRDIVDRCIEAKILHIAVDQESREGVVYIKTRSTEDAGLVFNYMNGQWYKNQLVTAKYLKVERYHQRFPDSRAAQFPLRN